MGLINTSLETIGEDVFVFKTKPLREPSLTIEMLDNTNLSCTSFSPATFSEARRPLLMRFENPTFSFDFDTDSIPDKRQMTCMPEEVFRPFNHEKCSKESDDNCTCSLKKIDILFTISVMFKTSGKSSYCTQRNLISPCTLINLIDLKDLNCRGIENKIQYYLL